MRHRSERLINEINVSGFVSIMLAILFLFLADAGRHAHFSRPAVDHAKVSHPVPVRGANREDAVVISVERDGRISLGNTRLALDELPAQLRDALNHSGERRVYVNADARAKYGLVLRVMEVLQLEKIGSVAFLVDERKTPDVTPGAGSTQ